MIPQDVNTGAPVRRVTEVFAEKQIRIGPEALRALRRHGTSAKPLRLGE